MVADGALDAWVDGEDFGGHDAAGGVGSGEETLGDDAEESAGELGDDLGLLLGREDVDDAVEGSGGAAGVEGGDDEVAGFCGGEGGGDAVLVAHFGDDEDVDVLAEGGAESGGEGVGVGADLALFDEAELVFEGVFDRVFDRDDHGRAGFKDAAGHGREGGGFAAAGHAGDEDEALAGGAEVCDGGGVAEFVEFRGRVWDVAEGGFDVAACEVGIAAEATDVFDGEGEVEFPVFFEFGALGVCEDGHDEFADAFAVEVDVFEGGEAAVDASGGRGVRGEVEVGAAGFARGGEVVEDVAGHGIVSVGEGLGK